MYMSMSMDGLKIARRVRSHIFKIAKNRPKSPAQTSMWMLSKWLVVDDDDDDNRASTLISKVSFEWGWKFFQLSCFIKTIKLIIYSMFMCFVSVIQKQTNISNSIPQCVFVFVYGFCFCFCFSSIFLFFSQFSFCLCFSHSIYKMFSQTWHEMQICTAYQQWCELWKSSIHVYVCVVFQTSIFRFKRCASFLH